MGKVSSILEKNICSYYGIDNIVSICLYDFIKFNDLTKHIILLAE